MDKPNDMFSKPLFDYINSIDKDDGNADKGIPNYSASKLKVITFEASKRATDAVKELELEIKDDIAKSRKKTDRQDEWEDGEIVDEEKDNEKYRLISDETKESIKKMLDKLMAIFLAGSIALSVATVGFIYLKHKDDPKPWEIENESETSTLSHNDQATPAFIVTPTPVDSPVVPSSEGYVKLDTQETDETESLDERED